MVLKVDLSKSYDKVNWIYSILILIQLRFCASFVSWVMNNISSISFLVLINGSTMFFFNLGNGIQCDWPLSPLIFLLVVEGWSRLLKSYRVANFIKGIKISNALFIYHLLFVDDVLSLDVVLRQNGRYINLYYIFF